MQASTAIENTGKRPSPAHVFSRVATSLVGGWIFVWGCIAAGIPLLLWAGVSFEEARRLTHLLAFLIYLTAACWAFVAMRLWRVALVLCGGGAALTALGWLMTRTSV